MHLAAMRQSRLPLRGIAVFATVARLGSLKAAASELNLSPSAVSHAIRALEEELGVELFKRVSRGVRLTPDAARYAEILQGLFERMRRATADIAGPRLEPRLGRRRAHHDAAVARDPTG